MPPDDTTRSLVALWHLEAARVIGRVARIVRDVGLAEDIAQDVLVTALERWPADGLPANPAAWELDFAHQAAAADVAERLDAALYDVLAHAAPSPVVRLNQAVAVGMAFGPAAGLEIVEQLHSEGSLDGYPLLPAVRGDLLSRLNRSDEARTEFLRAAGLTRNAREQALLQARADACLPPPIEAR
ncbi:hypothetical protein [Zoogloea sp.]|uniref:hypothetical protein n=1 Tax=Zoogloea sp. TaxID=49181 RepID=UPI0025F9CE0D|nr:hypothetical protein [Zoogloea sp.]MCK6394586.1 hypothetical protein [Zoogloea sp.]